MIRALGYLWVRTVCNRVRLRMRRLRQPKYLAGAVVGMLYLWGAFFRNIWNGRWGTDDGAAVSTLSAEMAAGIEIAAAWFLLGVIAWFWIVPSRRAALEFSEAEMQHLFPAPITRRGLIRFKLAQWQLGLLFTSLMVSFFSGRLWNVEGASLAILSWWMLLLLIQLHSLAASFVRTRLLDWGLPHWKRRAFAAGLFGLVLVGCGFWAYRHAPPWPSESGDMEAFAEWGIAFSGITPMAELLMPFRWIVRPVFVREVSSFLATAVPVLVLIVLHYRWVLRSAVAFEEASVDAARTASERAASAELGSRAQSTVTFRAPILMKLGPQGAPWVALAWKNLGDMGKMYRSRRWAGFVVGLGIVSALVISGIGSETLSNVFGTMAMVVWLISVLAGPGQAKVGLRSALSGTNWERLRALPLRGWQIVLGEMLMPWLELLGLQAFLAFCGSVLLHPGATGEEVGLWDRGWIWMGLVVLGPGLTGLGFCVHGAAALFFPAWLVSGTALKRGGFEVLGQQMIVLFGQALVMLVAVVPAAIVGAFVYFGVAYLGGAWLGFSAMAFAAAAVLLTEIGASIWLLGMAWEQLDLSVERAV